METNEELRRFKWIFENIQDVYYEATLDGVLLEVSPSVTLLSRGQFKREDLIGRSLLELYARPSEREEFYATIMKNGFVRDYELDVKNGDGSVVPCSISTKLVFDDSGNPEKICGTLRDISERKKTEVMLLRQSAELYEANATKDKFFSIIAHDLKSPFQAILGFSELLVSTPEDFDKEETTKCVGMIQNAAKKAYDLLENLLLWSRSQRGLLDFNPEHISLKAKVEEVVSLARLAADKKGVILENLLADDIKVYADPQMLDTILRNLIANAVKFTYPGGKVEVGREEAAVGQGSCAAVGGQGRFAAVDGQGHFVAVDGQGSFAAVVGQEIVNEDFVEVFVRDTGVGIPDDMLEKIFRVDSATSTPGTANEKGTGLGLILCREFAERNGGSISAESTLGKGSVFRLRLKRG